MWVAERTQGGLTMAPLRGSSLPSNPPPPLGRFGKRLQQWGCFHRRTIAGGSLP